MGPTSPSSEAPALLFQGKKPLKSDWWTSVTRMGLREFGSGGQAGGGDANGCVCAPFPPEFDNFEFRENRDVRGGIDAAPAYLSLFASLLRQRLPRTRRLFEALIGLSFSTAEKPVLRLFFSRCYPFLLNNPPSFPLASHPTFFLHAPYTLQQLWLPRPPPFAHPCSPALPFLRLGHDRPSKPAYRCIFLRIRPKRAHPLPCPDAKANTPPCVLHRPP